MRKQTLTPYISIIIFLIIAIIILSALGLFKEIIISRLEKEIGKAVNIGNIRYIPFKGIVIKNLKIHEHGSEEKILLKTAEINFDILLRPLLKREISIPSLNVNNLDIVLENDPKSEEWNFSSIRYFKEPKEPKRLKKKFSFNIDNITLRNGSLRVTNNLFSPAFSKEIKNVEVSGVISKEGRSNIELSVPNLYAGQLKVVLMLDSEKNATRYEVIGDLRSLKIEDVLKDTKYKNWETRGNVNNSVKIQGTAGDPDSIKGEAWIHVTDADLGPLPIFTPVIANLLHLFGDAVPGYNKIMLKEATGIFTISDRKIATHNFILWGDEASVLYDGNIDFEGNLDFYIKNNFIEGLVGDTSRTNNLLPAFIAGIGDLVSEGHLGGTIKEPKYEFRARGGFDKFFKEKFQAIFRDILQ